jgi:hypothetical protein
LKTSLSILCAASISLSLTGCASDRAARLAAAERGRAEASLVEEALKPQPLPDLPADCRRKEASGAKAGDRLDVAWFKAEDALWRANARVARCAGFYDKVKAGRAG